MFTVNSIKHSWHERSNFRLLREHGTKDYVFLHFITPVKIVLDKKTVNAASHSCIIYPPDSYHEFYSENTPLNHDWIHFLISDKKLFDDLLLPVNKLFHPKESGFITSMTSIMELEFIAKRPFWDKHIDGLLTSMFSLIARQVINTDNIDHVSTEQKIAFDKLRLSIFNSPSLDWNIDTMAKRVKLSRSRFSVLYMKFYKTSAGEDLIKARLEYAKYLLATTDMTIRNISDSSGYVNIEHFTRQFKKRINCTPSEYRKSCV